MAVGDRNDPYRSYNFLVEIDGITRAGFRECSGLDTTQDPIDYREGNQDLTTRKLPGLVKYSNISLKYGITDDAELWEWRKKVCLFIQSATVRQLTCWKPARMSGMFQNYSVTTAWRRLSGTPSRQKRAKDGL